LLTTYPSDFQTSLTYLRQELGLSMVALARKLDISEAYISLLESGKRQPSRKFVKRLLAACQQDFPAGFAQHLQDLTGFEFDSAALAEPYILTQGPQKFRHFTSLVLALIREHHYEQASQEIQRGLHYFQKPLEINMLAGYLELTRGNYAQALVAMQAAQQIAGLSLAQDVSSEFAPIEILANIGTVYFTMGSEQLGVKGMAELEGRQTDAEAAQQQALNLFQQAQGYLQQVLTEQPDHLYALDEQARLLFNLADLEQGTQADACWQQVIAAYQKVLAHPERFQMPQPHLWEAGCFLAHAHSKLKQFEQARTQLNLILSYQPQYWFAWYVLACCYNLNLQEEDDPKLLRSGKAALERAIQLNAAAQEQSELDPDLALLRDEDALSDSVGTL